MRSSQNGMTYNVSSWDRKQGSFKKLCNKKRSNGINTESQPTSI